jgi:hypothetical protein
MEVKEKIWSGHCCQKFFVSWIFFEPITTQSQPNHISIFVHPMFAGPPNSLFFATFGINTPSPKSRDACKLLEPLLVPLQNCFVHTSWSMHSNKHHGCVSAPWHTSKCALANAPQHLQMLESQHQSIPLLFQCWPDSVVCWK